MLLVGLDNGQKPSGRALACAGARRLAALVSALPGALGDRKRLFRASRRWTIYSGQSRSWRGVVASQRRGCSPALPNDEVPGGQVARGLAAQRGFRSMRADTVIVLVLAVSACRRGSAAGGCGRGRVYHSRPRNAASQRGLASRFWRAQAWLRLTRSAPEIATSRSHRAVVMVLEEVVPTEVMASWRVLVASGKGDLRTPGLRPVPSIRG